MSNLSISLTIDNTAWDNFLRKSHNKNIYSHSLYLDNLGEKYQKFFVLKDQEIFASFFLRFDDEKIKLSDKIIYTPVIFKNFVDKPLSSINTIKFEIINEIKNFFISNYRNVEFTSDYFLNDLRPFYWHNFETNKEIFKIKDLKYTSVVDLSKIDDTLDLEETFFFKNLSVRVRQQFNYAKKKRNYKVDCNFCKRTIKDTITKTFERQNKKINFDLNLHCEILEKLNDSELINMITIKENDIKKAFLIFSRLKNQSIYLFGGRLTDDKDDYSLTYGMINSFINLKKLGVSYVDLEGINSPNRGFNKLGYGGNIFPYYTIQMNN